MKTSGLFTLHRHRIQIKKAGEPIRLIIFGDVHRDSPMHAAEQWQAFLEMGRKAKNAYFLGMGDYIDSMSTSEREAMIRATMHDTTSSDLEHMASAKVTGLAKELAFMKGRLIGLVNGNHFFSFPSGINSDQKLCEKLECKYLGASSFIRVEFDYNGSRMNFDIWAHHGAGGSRLPGGSINRVDQMREHAEADCYIMGHDHKRAVVPSNPRFHLAHSSREGMQLNARQQWLVRSGSYLESYRDGHTSYNVDSARGPVSIGHCELEITFHDTLREGKRLRTLSVRGIA